MTTTYYNKYQLPDITGSPTYAASAAYLRWVGGKLGFKDINSGGSGQICTVSAATQKTAPGYTKIALYTIVPGVSTLSATSFTLLDFNLYSTVDVHAVMQSDDGKVHFIVCDAANAATFVYYRFALTYTGTSITGATQEASFNVFTPTDEVDSKCVIDEVVCNDGTRRIMAMITNDLGTTLALRMCTWSTTETSASGITDLSGAAGTTLLSTRSGLNAHGTGGSFLQVRSSKAILVTYGDTSAEFPTRGASSYWLTPTGTISWTVGTRVDDTDTVTVDVGGLARTANTLYRVTLTGDGTQVAKFSSFSDTGTRTDGVWPNVAYGDSAGYACLSVSDDGSVAYFAMGAYSGGHKLARLSGGTWDVHSMTAYTDVYALGGIAWSNGLIVIASDLITYNRPIVSGVVDTVDNSSVTGTQTSAQPGQTSTIFQDITLVMGAQTTSQPQEIGSAQQNAIPTFVGVGATLDSAAAGNVALPANLAIGDGLLLLVETANETSSIANQNGGNWTAVTNSPQGTGTAGGTSATRITAYVDRYNGTQTAPGINDAGNHQIAAILAFRGIVPVGNWVHITAGSVKGTSSTTTSIPGVTTTVANCLAVYVASRMDDSAAAHWSGWADASLTNVAQLADIGGTGGNGGGFGVAAGGKATAGATGSMTATNATTTTNGFLCLALQGAVAGTANVLGCVQNPDVPAQTDGLTQSNQSNISPAAQTTAQPTETVAISNQGIATAQTTAQPTETATLQTPNVVSPANETTAQATQTGTSSQPNSVSTGETTAQATQTDTLGQMSAVSAAEDTVAPEQTDTLRQVANVATVASTTQPAQTEAATQYFVAGSNTTAQPLEATIVAQGNIAEGSQLTTQPAQTDAISNQRVSGAATTTQPAQTGTSLQTSSVATGEATMQPVQTGTSLQTNAVTASEQPNEPTQTDNVVQGAGVIGVGTTAAPAEFDVITQASRVATLQAVGAPSNLASIWQYSSVAGSHLTAQPAETAAIGQVFTVVAVQIAAQPIATELIQQGGIVAALQVPALPDETGGATQPSRVTGAQSADEPDQYGDIQSSSLILGLQLTSQVLQVEVITTYQPAYIFGNQHPPQPGEWCAITTTGPLLFPYIKARMVRLPPIRSRKVTL